MVRMSEIVEMLSQMKGSINVFPLNQDCRSKIWDIEKDIKAALGIPVINLGVEECLKRQHVVCIIKNRTFRPPPEATVVLISDNQTVLGEEILPHRKKEFLEKNEEDVVWLSEEFVMYPGRTGGQKEWFVMPPVSFPEVAAYEGITDVASCSPSAPADMMLRQMHGYEDDPKLASILVGFNSDSIEL